MKKLIVLSLIMVGLASSCYYDNAEELYQNYPQSCDVSDVTYSVDIVAIINAQCISCHSGPSPQGQLDLSTYNNVMMNAVVIRDRINRPAGSAGVMPEGGKLNDCDLKKFNAWIDAGAPNN